MSNTKLMLEVEAVEKRLLAIRLKNIAECVDRLKIFGFDHLEVSLQEVNRIEQLTEALAIVFKERL
jgi:hypothetical protein